MIVYKISFNQDLQQKTNTMELNYKRTRASSFKSDVKMTAGRIVMPSLCETYRLANNECSNLILTSQVREYYKRSSFCLILISAII